MSEAFVWIGPVRHIGGYGEVARAYLGGLRRIGADVVAVDAHGPVGEPDGEVLAEMEPLLEGPVISSGRTCVYHGAPNEIGRLLEAFPMPDAERRVVCTISETDRLPESWVASLAPFDEVWVPATFHREVFALSGVPREKLRVVRYGVDAERWIAGSLEAEAPSSGPFRFLYCFQLGWRKGFDLLLEAYLGAFTRDDDVELVLKLLPGPSGGPTRADLVTSIADRIDFLAGDLPPVKILEGDFNFDEMRALYRSANLYISTDRANGWGMPCHEAMACGTAAAAIDWSGSTEFMHEGNALLIPPGELVPVDPRLVACHPDYGGQRWPSVAVEDVRGLLRHARAEPQALAALGRRAAQEIASDWSLERAAGAIVGRQAGHYRSRSGLLDKLLPSLGMQAPSGLVEGARSRIFVCPFRPGEDDWRKPLRQYLERYSAADDVTLCLWADTDTDQGLEKIAGEIASLLGLGQAEPGSHADVQLTVAPCDHVPWECVEFDPELLPPGSRFARQSAIDGA